MKTCTGIFLTVLLLAFTVRVSLAAPPLTAVAVAQIAQKDLEERGLQDSVYIQQMAYKGKLGEPKWEVFWSKRFPAQTEGFYEIGLKVLMDGSYQRLVKKR